MPPLPLVLCVTVFAQNAHRTMTINYTKHTLSKVSHQYSHCGVTTVLIPKGIVSIALKMTARVGASIRTVMPDARDPITRVPYVCCAYIDTALLSMTVSSAWFAHKHG